MKTIKALIVIIFNTFFIGLSMAQCPSGDVLLSTQAEVDQFLIDYPNCITVNADLVIGQAIGLIESDITDISGLSSIINVSNDLIIRNNPSLITLTGLDNIFECTSLIVSDNKSIVNLTGLSSIQTINSKLTINGNEKLVDFIGFNSIDVIENEVEIFDNIKLESLAGLESLNSIKSSFDIYNNPLLNSLIGINNLSLVKSSFSINNNNSLTNLDGLSPLLSVIGILYINENDLLTTCHVEAVCNYLSNNNNAIIENNNTNCNSIAEVTNACNTIDCNINISTFTLHTSCGNNNGSINLSDVSGNHPFAYLWSNGDTTQSLLDIAAGIYSLTITDSINCTYISSYTVNQSSAISYRDSLNFVYCGEDNGSLYLLDFLGVAPFDVLWEDGSTGDSIINLSPAYYSFTITDATGCSLIDSINVFAITSVDPNTHATEETAQDANDGTASVLPSNGLPPYSVLWSTGDTTFMITGLMPTIYSVTVTDDTGCEVVATVNVPTFSCNNFLATPNIMASICFGSCDGTIDLNVTGGNGNYSYSWDGLPDTTELINNLCFGTYFYVINDSDGCRIAGGITNFQASKITSSISILSETYIGQNDGIASIDTIVGGKAPYKVLWSTMDTTYRVDSLAPGTYYVTISDVSQCNVTDTINILAGNCSLLTLQDNIHHDGCIATCMGYITIDSIEGGNGPFTYLWNEGSTINSIDSLCAGNYSVTITGVDSCLFIKNYIIQQGDSSISSTVDITYESGLNAGDASATVSITGGNPPFIFGWATGDTSLILDSLSAGTYEYVISDASGCFYSNSVTIPAFDCSIFTIESISHNTGCYGSSNGSASFIGISSIQNIQSIKWSNGSLDSSITNLIAGEYTIEVQLDSTCTLSDTITIGQNDEIIISIDNLIHLTDTTNASISITSQGGQGAISYEWQGPDGYTSTDMNINDISIGCYSISLLDSLGCTTSMDSICIEDFTVGLSKLEHKLDIKLFPNPIIETIYLDYNKDNETIRNTMISIWSLTGDEIYTQIAIKDRINVSQLQSGVYFLKVNSNTTTNFIRFVKVD